MLTRCASKTRGGGGGGGNPTICVPVISFDECRYIRILLSISNLEVDEFYSIFSLLCVSIFTNLNDAEEDDEDEDEDVYAGEAIILLMIMMLTMMDFRSYLSCPGVSGKYIERRRN